MKNKELTTTYRLIGMVFLVSIVIGLFYYIAFSKTNVIAKRDFVSFLTSAQMLRVGERSNFYNLETQNEYQQKVIWPEKSEGVLPFKYLAVFSLPFLPLTFLSLRHGYIIFAFFNLIVLGVLAYISSNIFTRINNIRYWFLIPFIFLPNILTIILGQLSIILAFIYLQIYKSIHKKHALLAGVTTGLLLIKPQYVIAAPFFLMLTPDRKRFLYGFLASSLVIIFSSIYLSDTKAILNYLDFLLATENASFLERSQRMITISSSLFYNLPLEIGYNAALYVNATLYILIYYLFLKRYKLIEVDLAFVSATLFSLLFAVHVLDHDLSILLIPVFILINYSFKKSKPEKRTILIFASLLFFLPIIILISPLAGTLIALGVAMILMQKGRNLGRIWAAKK